jgi:diadenosine tetraphosphatase ApaH/serine/threonine PP2A family protein phosphatase
MSSAWDGSEKPNRNVCEFDLRKPEQRHEVLRRLASARGNSRCAFISSWPPGPFERTVGCLLVHTGGAFPACGRSRMDRDPFSAIQDFDGSSH